MNYSTSIDDLLEDDVRPLLSQTQLLLRFTALCQQLYARALMCCPLLERNRSPCLKCHLYYNHSSLDEKWSLDCKVCEVCLIDPVSFSLWLLARRTISALVITHMFPFIFPRKLALPVRSFYFGPKWIIEWSPFKTPSNKITWFKNTHIWVHVLFWNCRVPLSVFNT